MFAGSVSPDRLTGKVDSQHDVFGAGASAYQAAEGDQFRYHAGGDTGWGGVEGVRGEGCDRGIHEAGAASCRCERSGVQDGWRVGRGWRRDEGDGGAEGGGRFGANTAYTDFINRMMDPDPTKRLSPTEARNHPFLADPLLDEAGAREVLKRVLAPKPPAPQSPAKHVYDDDGPPGGKRVYDDDGPPGGKRVYDDDGPPAGKRVYDDDGPPGGKRVYDDDGPSGGKRVYDDDGPPGGKRVYDDGGPPGGKNVQADKEQHSTGAAGKEQPPPLPPFTEALRQKGAAKRAAAAKKAAMEQPPPLPPFTGHCAGRGLPKRRRSHPEVRPRVGADAASSGSAGRSKTWMAGASPAMTGWQRSRP